MGGQIQNQRLQFCSRYNNNNIQNMKSLFCGVLLLAISYSLSHHRLSTTGLNQTKSLKQGDSIVSTLGLFKATLIKSGCNLNVQMFNNVTNTYESKGKYNSSTYSGDCAELAINDGRLEVGGNQYLSVINAAYNYSTIFTIDDQGVMRLIGTYIQENRVDIVSNETVIDRFKTDNKYVKSFSQLSVTFGDRFDAFENQRKWKFIAQFGQLTIYYGENPALKIDYVFSSITIRDSRIYDFDNQTFPGTLFNNITLQPRCSEPQMYLDFKPPYVFVANPYWPQVSIYEQGGYKIHEVSYGDLLQYDYNQNITEINYNPFYSPCPSRTFEYRGNCFARCPAPYYHQIKGQSGFCVLKCEEFASVNHTTRFCGCVTQYQMSKLSLAKLVQSCPGNAIETLYGCQCKDSGYFYDGKLSFSCVKNCPNGTLGINQLCMSCPVNCITCQRDSFNRQFLECKNCSNGYTLSFGQCILSCVTNYGHSLINNQCVQCQDNHCVDCSNDANICLRCDLMYSLSNGSCVDACNPFGQKNVYASYFSSQCIAAADQMCISYLTSHYNGVAYVKCDQCFPGSYSHLDKCVSQCPPGYYVHNNYCTCGGVANLTINDKCLNQIACPIGMSFDIRSHSCLSCPFGCISCVNTECIACNPGYFLYVSPQSILCRKKSPLFPCDQQYSWQRNTTCMLVNYTDPNLMMISCQPNVENCQVCIPHSDQICVVCNVGYYIYNNTCIKTCPTGMIPFDNTCILPEINNCSVPHLRSNHKQAIITQASMETSESYGYYTYNKMERANDPVGYMPYFQQLTTHKTDGIPRDTDFFTPDWICLKCNDGFGLSQDYKSCLPCPSECANKACYMARNDSCLSPGNATCRPDEYIDQQTGACLQSCNQSSKYPQIKEGKLYCMTSFSAALKDYTKVDSAVYQMKDGKKLVFFVFSNQLKTNAAPNVIVKSFNRSAQPLKVQDVLNDTLTNSTTTPTTPTPPTTPTTPTTPGTNQSNILGPNTVSSPTFSAPIVDGEYVELGEQNYNAYLMNLSQSILNLTGVNQPIVFPSKVYGTVYQADHTVFMTTWLAFIGYIMSIVVILLHAVFIGNELLYKVDNLLIFIQTLFYFSYVKNLVGRLLAQFYFGWSFAHARFLPNLFDPIIPDHYVEREAPVSYKLVNIDGNYFRNAGFSLAWLLIYIGIWATITFVVWALINRLGRKHQSWYPRVARQSLIAGFQFFSMNLAFFSVSQLAYSYGAWQGGFQDYFDRSQILAIITLCVIFLYTVLRLMFNSLGGIYMLKRILIAVILVFAYYLPILIIPLICLEIIFSILRHIIQKPISKFQKVTIWGQAILLIACYALLFFVLDAGVNSIIISLFIFIFIVYLAYDLTTLYLESLHQYPEEQLAKNYEEMASQLNNKQRAQTVLRIADKKYEAQGVPSRGGSIVMMDNNY